MFQCPTTGFLLFYIKNNETGEILTAEFQCPTTGFLLFYNFQNFQRKFQNIRFNALPRAFFFSTLLSLIAPSSHKIVSMPYLGLSSFLHIKNRINYETRKLFQCPTSGFLLFYIQHESDMPEFIRFQCPTTGFLLFYASIII